MAHLQSVQHITQQHTAIFLSPHFDDAVFSCGGTIALHAKRGERPLVITMFAGMPRARCGWSSLAFKVHRGMGLGRWLSRESAEIVAKRRLEDSCALDFLQADYLWLNYADAIYRGQPPYYTHVRQLIGNQLHARDYALIQQIGYELLTLHSCFPQSTWYIPLGIGCHIDHQIVFAAAQALMLYGAHVCFYEDFPYVVRKDALMERMRTLSQPFMPFTVKISQLLYLREIAAELYASQVGICFRNRIMMQKLLREYACSLEPDGEPAERYWLPIRR